mmetsp:Transcript_24978/g.29518  ORF Transcript_24978/g.29518 Transcript_24978/m.29518 type:complete len:185 (+) Transcript_24978:106-660(+)
MKESSIIETEPHAQAIPISETYDVDRSSAVLPYPGEHKWHHGIFSRCCSCGGDCWLAWCCPCVSLAQISSKVGAIDGEPYCLSFNMILGIGIFLYCLSLLFGSIYPSMDSFFTPFNIFNFVVCFQLRRIVRIKLKIVPNDGCCVDCLCSYFCLPCVITQMMGTLWLKPHEVPDCTWNDSVATIV